MRNLSATENFMLDNGPVFPDNPDEAELFVISGSTDEQVPDGLYYYLSGQWRSSGTVGTPSGPVTISIIGSENVITYWDAIRNKTLSTGLVQFVFGHPVAYDLTWLGAASSLGANQGYSLPLDATIVKASVNILDVNGFSGDLNLYINDTLVGPSLTISGNAGDPFSGIFTLDIDVSGGDIIRARTSISSIDKKASFAEVVIVFYARWRKA